MRLVIASDTHSRHDELLVPDGDVFIHCGDFSMMGYVQEVVAFGRWVRQLPHRHKIVIAGNHDLCFESKPMHAYKYLTESTGNSVITYLQDSAVEIDGIRFWGSPWQPRFYNWAFNLDRGSAIAQKWALIPKDTDVLITHGPPAGILDHVPRTGDMAGCHDLLAVVDDINPVVHAFGHIHEGSGILTRRNTVFINASICDEHYRPVNPCRVVDVLALDEEEGHGEALGE